MRRGNSRIGGVERRAKAVVGEAWFGRANFFDGSFRFRLVLWAAAPLLAQASNRDEVVTWRSGSSVCSGETLSFRWMTKKSNREAPRNFQGLFSPTGASRWGNDPISSRRISTNTSTRSRPSPANATLTSREQQRQTHPLRESPGRKLARKRPHTHNLHSGHFVPGAKQGDPSRPCLCYTPTQPTSRSEPLTPIVLDIS